MEIMNEQILTSLSIITLFHDKSRSIVDSFLPVVEYGIALLYNDSGINYSDIETLQKRINDSTGIFINVVALKSLLKSLQKTGLIERYNDGTYYRIINSIQKSQDRYLHAVNSSDRDVRKFIHEYKSFSGDDRSDADIINMVYSFICDYRQFIDVNNCGLSSQFENQKYQSLLLFLEYINESESSLVNTFHAIYFGANIYALLQNTNNIIKNRDFNSLIIYLDSNFILRLMDLQEEYFHKETLELYSILKSNGIKLRVFEETIEEVKSVISYYASMYEKEPEAYSMLISDPSHISGVLGAIFRKKYTNSQIADIIDGVDKCIEDFGIVCDSINRYRIQADEEKVEQLYRFKYLDDDVRSESYRRKKCEHYVQIIDIIKYLRRRDKCVGSCLGNSKYVFLTCDLKLYRYNKINDYKHKFPTVVSQELLANDLLLFDPKTFGSISFQLLVSLYKSSNHVDIHTLDRLKYVIQDVANEDPSEASLIIAATRNCESYSVLNEIAECEDEEGKRRLFELAEENRRKEQEKKQEVDNLIMLIQKKESENANAQKEIDALTKELNNKDQLQEQSKIERQTEREAYFVTDMQEYIKRIKRIITPLCAVGAGVIFVISISTGLYKWFDLPFSQNWWIWLLVTIGTIFTILLSIYNGTDNKILEKQINKKAKKLAKKYSICEERLPFLKQKYME